jgi:hypothetical protein
MKLKTHFVEVLLPKSSTAPAFDVRLVIDDHNLFRFPITAKASVDVEALSLGLTTEAKGGAGSGTNDWELDEGV